LQKKNNKKKHLLPLTAGQTYLYSLRR